MLIAKKKPQYNKCKVKILYGIKDKKRKEEKRIDKIYITERRIVNQYAERGIKPIDIKFDRQLEKIVWVYSASDLLTANR